MTLTTSERESRNRALRKILETEDLQALFLIGDMNVGHHFYGDHRYYTDNRIIFYRQAVVIFPRSEPVLFAGSEIQRQAALRRSSVKDCRLIGDTLIADVAQLLKERGIFRGRVGVNLEMLPAAWYRYLTREMPQVEWVETHDQIMKIRLRRSEEEVGIYRKGAALGDAGFEAALKIIRPGVSEFDGAPMILAMVLGQKLETAFRRSLIMSRGDLSVFISRPISLGFLIIAILLLILPVITQRRKLSALEASNV